MLATLYYNSMKQGTKIEIEIVENNKRIINQICLLFKNFKYNKNNKKVKIKMSEKKCIKYQNAKTRSSLKTKEKFRIR